MFRRSRLSIRPNVGTVGKTGSTPQEASPNKEQDNTNTQIETLVSVTDNTPTDSPAEPANEQTPCTDQNAEATSSSAIQRRKRFSVRPKVVPGRPSALPRTPKSPIKPVLPTVKSPVQVVNKAETSIEANAAASHQELLAPKECQPPDENRCSPIDVASPSEVSNICVDNAGKIQSSSCSQVKEISVKTSIPPSIPDRETVDISEKAKTLVSKTDLKTSSQHFSLTQLLNDKSDLIRLEKARKLRQLLKQEMLKEKSKKYMARIKECTLDPSKMTMRDLIHYLPTCNPMSSSVEESAQENETAIPQSPDTSPERAQEQEVQPKILSPCHGEATATTAEGEQDREEEEAEEEAEDDEALMVPQVKVAEDGSLIIDEESLTVEVKRMKGPNPIQDRDPIFERGSTTTYSSFRKGTHTKPWSTEETDMFFLAISMVGTDFAMISQLFPHRDRSEIKNKFKKEERFNAWRIDKAFRERRKLDLEYFKKLLEKILEFQQNKKKLKSISEKPQSSKRKTKRKIKKAMAEQSDVEEEDVDGVSIEEEEGEKENLCKERASTSKIKRKRKRKDVIASEKPVDKKKKTNIDGASALADSEEADTCEDHLSLDQPKKKEKQAAKTANSKAGKPPPLGRKGLKTKKSKAIVSDTEVETSDEMEKQMKKDSLALKHSTKRNSDNECSESDHENTVQSATPTRYGRIPKPVQPLNYPAKEDTNLPASETVSSSACQTTDAKPAKNKTHAKRRKLSQQKTAKEYKKMKLITLRASQSEGSDDDENEEETSGLHFDDENSTNAFVPASLCSPKPVVQEVQESMEEFDLLAHMPDVLDMSTNAMCPDASCEQLQSERDSVEPCEHQLDLLVDVIDFLSDHAEASEDEDHNEAAQTLLEIGNLTNLAQPTESQPSLSEEKSKFESSPCSEVDDLTGSTFEQEECTVFVSEQSQGENIQTNCLTDQTPKPSTSNTQVVEPSEDLSNTEDNTSSTQCSTLRASSLPPRKGRLSKVKPKPNVGSATRMTKHLPQNNDSDLKLQQVTVEQLKDSTAVSDPLRADKPADDSTGVTSISHYSNMLLSDEPCCIQVTIDSLQLQKTSEPKINSPPHKKASSSWIQPNISCNLRTTKQTTEALVENSKVENEVTSASQLISLENQEEPTQTVLEQDEQESETPLEPSYAKNSLESKKQMPSELKDSLITVCVPTSTNLASQSVQAIEGKLQEESEMAATSQLRSSEHEVEIAQTVYELSNFQIKITDGTIDDKLASQAFDKQVIKQSDEPSTTQEMAPTSQLQTSCSKNSSVPRKGRFSKIKPKPNVGSASRPTKQSSQSAVATDVKQTLGETATASPPQSLTPSSEPVVEVCRNSLASECSLAESHTFSVLNIEISEPHKQRKESGTIEPHSDQLTEMSYSTSIHSAEEPLDPDVNTSSLEPGTIPSVQSDLSSAGETTENIPPVLLSDPHSEKHCKPQTRRWVPKVKPKPNLLLSPRTTKSRLESKDMTKGPDQFVKPCVFNATSEQPVLQDSTPAETYYHLQSVNVSTKSTSGVSLDKDMTNLSRASTSENPTIAQEHCEPTVINQANVEPHNLMECVPSDSSKLNATQHQFEDLTCRKKEICLISKTSNILAETSKISTDHSRPAEGAVDPSTAQCLGSGQMQDSSVQNSTEYKGLLFPNIPPEQVPSDPDEPFFILSLTEIPVCPSGEGLHHEDPGPQSYHALPHRETQQSNPVEPVVPLAAGIDDSLSNIHIPTPEKAALRSGHICVEDYLISDMSLLEEPQEHTSIERQNVREAESNIEHLVTVTADRRPSVRGAAAKSRRTQNLTRKAADKKNNHENTIQSRAESLRHIESGDERDSQAPKDSDVRKTVKTRGRKSQAKNTKVTGESTEILRSETSSSKDNQFTSSKPIDPNLNDSATEPTSMSEHFFGDVFTEVQSDCSDTGNTTDNTVSQDKAPPSRSTETPTNLRQHSQEEKKPRGRGKGNANRKNKTSGDAEDENSRPHRKTTTKLAKPMSQDNLKQHTSSSSTVPPQSHETKLRSPQNTSEILDSHQNDSVGGNFLEEEPTNVSEYFLSDVFTEAQSNELPDSEKSSSYSSFPGPAPRQPDSKKTRGKGPSKKSLRKSTEAMKTPDATVQESLKETQATSSAQGSFLKASKVKNDSAVEVDSGSSSVSETNNIDCVDKTSASTSETSRNTKKKRKTKASSGPPLIQKRAHESSVIDEVQNTNTSSQPVVERTRGKKHCDGRNLVDGALSASCSTIQPELQATNENTSKESSLFDDEPTNVSQYFLSDIFTDVDEEFKS